MRPSQGGWREIGKPLTVVDFSTRPTRCTEARAAQ
jgi:hypothetical protein